MFLALTHRIVKLTSNDIVKSSWSNIYPWCMTHTLYVVLYVKYSNYRTKQTEHIINILLINRVKDTVDLFDCSAAYLQD